MALIIGAKHHKMGSENILSMITGGVAAIIGDWAWKSLALPGYDTPSSLEFLSVDDAVQMAGAFALTAYGFSQGFSRIAPFGFGALGTQVITKVLLPAFNMPRYILWDITPGGKLIPTQRWPQEWGA